MEAARTVSRERQVRRAPVTQRDRELDAIYAEIPKIPACNGSCAVACGPITMTTGEWDRIKRAKGYEPKGHPDGMCPMLSPSGRCSVYTARPWICRIWGSVEEMRCPAGCEPERWLSQTEAHDLFERVMAVAGPGTAGPLGKVDDLWRAVGLPPRRARAIAIERMKNGS
jgi:Fe-S-cluster containining protein